MDTPEFYVNHIYPSVENAKNVIDLRYRDMRRAGLSEEKAKSIADSKDDNHIDRQIQLLENYPARYLGVIALKSDNLVAFSNTSEWTAEDLLPYCGIVERFAMQAMMKCIGNRFIGNSVGLHELVVDCAYVAESLDVIEKILDSAMSHADTKQIFVATYQNKIIEGALTDRQFNLISKTPFSSKEIKDLYVRPLPVSKHDLYYEDSSEKHFKSP